jgi:hypothetical protein
MPTQGERNLRADENIHCEQVSPSPLFTLGRGMGFTPGSSSLRLAASAVSCQYPLPPPHPSVQPQLIGLTFVFPQSFAQIVLLVFWEKK